MDSIIFNHVRQLECFIGSMSNSKHLIIYKYSTNSIYTNYIQLYCQFIMVTNELNLCIQFHSKGWGKNLYTF